MDGQKYIQRVSDGRCVFCCVYQLDCLRHRQECGRVVPCVGNVTTRAAGAASITPIKKGRLVTIPAVRALDSRKSGILRVSGRTDWVCLCSVHGLYRKFYKPRQQRVQNAECTGLARPFRRFRAILMEST